MNWVYRRPADYRAKTMPVILIVPPAAPVTELSAQGVVVVQ